MKAWVQITSGRGPEECCWVVSRLMEVFQENARGAALNVELLDAVPAGYSKTYRSILLALEGAELKQFLSVWEGTVQWVGYSDYRKNHRRKNWFVGVNVFFPAEGERDIYTRDIRYETMRASGPGGQHVNKTESAVRAIHLPSGKAVTAREERSQSFNKKLATARLIKMIQQETDEKSQALQDEVWHQHNCLERGNPIRVYRGKRFDLVSMKSSASR